MLELRLGEFKNVSSTVDASTAVYATSTATVTTSYSGDLVVGCACAYHSATTFTAGTGGIAPGMTILTQGNGNDASAIEYGLTGAAGSQAITINTIDANSPFFNITFKASSSFTVVGNDGDTYFDTANRKIYQRSSGVYTYIGSYSA